MTDTRDFKRLFGRDQDHRFWATRSSMYSSEFVREFAIAEFRTEDVARQKQRPPGTVARIPGETFVTAFGWDWTRLFQGSFSAAR